jgi:[ribosomal protein S5]-alanine N-acetyltransferase
MEQGVQIPETPPAPLFETARLRCRRWMPADLQDIYAIYSDPVAMRWVGDGQPITQAQCIRWLEVTEGNYARYGYGMFLLEDRDSGEVVGCCGLIHPEGQPEAEIKYAFLQSHWGRGLASETVPAMLACAASRFGLQRVIATVAPENQASQRILAKAGMSLQKQRTDDDGSKTLVYQWHAHDQLQRIHVIGNSASGKSTLAARLAGLLNLELVELDALNWEPNWVGLNATDPATLELRMQQATAGDHWVVAGSYTRFCQRVFWPKVQTVIWLDLPRTTLLPRVIRRSWRRWRTRELLWGTNYEQFWPQFFLWRKSESLIWWIMTQHTRKQREMRGYMADPRWSHIHFVRLVSAAEVEAFVERLNTKGGSDF